ncbi:MAG TPA: sialidase family protein [Burkholderiales bacterium]|nr:sialidase family protein [Burkholderiales bacterium]
MQVFEQGALSTAASRFSRALRKLACAAMVVSAAAHAPAADKTRQTQPPAPAGVATYDVHADSGGIHVLVGYGRKRPADLTLWHRHSGDGGARWSAPVRVNRPGEAVLAPHPGENPQIAAIGNRLLAAWTGPSPDGGRAGPISTALSADGGRTWQAGPNPSEGSTRYHALVEVEPAFGAFHMVWLHQDEGSQALHYTSSADGGRTWRARKLLASQTCNCCWNRIVVTPDRTVRVLYRGAEPRDMMLVSSPDGNAWRFHGAVGRFGWDFAGCPHVGGAIAAAPGGKALHALVWTGQESHAGLHHLSSTDGGLKWGAPRRIGGDAAKNSDLAIAADGTLMAVWDALEAHGVIYRAQSRDGGATWSAPERVSDPQAHASHPRVVWSPRGFATLWLETAQGAGTQLRLNGTQIVVPTTSPPAQSGRQLQSHKEHS